MPDQVDLHEPRSGVVPLRPGADRDLDFNSDPGLVCERPRSVIFARSAASRRSIVAGDIAINAHATSSVITSSRNRRSRGTNSSMIGASRLPVGAPSTAQQNANAAMTSLP